MCDIFHSSRVDTFLIEREVDEIVRYDSTWQHCRIRRNYFRMFIYAGSLSVRARALATHCARVQLRSLAIFTKVLFPITPTT